MKKRKDGIYQKHITLIDRDGTRLHKYVYAKTVTELREKEEKIRRDYEHGIFNPDTTIRQYTTEWIKNIETKNSIRTQEQYKSLVKKINHCIGGIPLQKLHRTDIQNMINQFFKYPRTAQLLKITIHKILESAIDDEIIYKNCCRNITLPNYKAAEKRALTEIEKQAMLKADFTDEERLFISLLYYTGLRRGEVLALSRKSIDLNNNIIHVTQSLTFDSNKGVLKEPKTKTSKRDVPIPDPLQSILREYKGGMYLFMRDNKMFTKTAYNCFWRSIIKKMNKAAGSKEIDKIQGLTAHIFRHNYATMLHDNKVDMKTAQMLLGHSSIAVTMDIYTHLDDIGTDTIETINNCFLAM